MNMMNIYDVANNPSGYIIQTIHEHIVISRVPLNNRKLLFTGHSGS